MAPKKKTEKKETVKKERKLDIFRVLNAADRKQINFYSGLDDDEAKEFAPSVVMRWLSTIEDRSKYAEQYLILVNELLNVGFWDLYKHPELQWKLMALTGSGQTHRHQWIPATKKVNTSKFDDLLLEKNPSLNDFELSIIKKKTTVESLTQLLKDMGLPDDEIKPILADFKKLDK